MVYPLKAFRMSDAQVPARLQVTVELIDECFLRRTVEIDHDVPTKDQIKRVSDREIIVHQVEPSKSDHGRQVWFDLKETHAIAAPAKKMSTQHVRTHASKSLFIVDARRRLG